MANERMEAVPKNQGNLLIAKWFARIPEYFLRPSCDEWILPCWNPGRTESPEDTVCAASRKNCGRGYRVNSGYREPDSCCIITMPHNFYRERATRD